MPVTWHGPEPGIGLRQIIADSYSFGQCLGNKVFPEGELKYQRYEKQTVETKIGTN
jgi:hypothetical protein